MLSAALLLALNENCHMAGEWFVGGFEAKGIAYALVLAGLAALVSGRWNATWIFSGTRRPFTCWLAGGPSWP